MREPNSDVGVRLSNCSDNDQHNAGILSRESSSSIGHSDLDGYEECFDKSGHSSRSSYSQSLVCSRETESAFSSPCSSLGKEDVRESGLDLLALPGLPPTKFQGSSPPSVLVFNVPMFRNMLVC